MISKLSRFSTGLTIFIPITLFTLADIRIENESSVKQPPKPNSEFTREKCIKSLKSGEKYDILIIGGGATGAGAALDAASRGLKVACIEREDFSSGTSSRSTKLIWAGSRYLVNAFVSLFNSDLRLITSPIKTIGKFTSEVKMVMNCHRERKFLLETNPHLTNWIPIAVPVSQWFLWPPPFGFLPASLGPFGLFYLFFKFYDAMGEWSSPPSHIMWPSRAARKYPQLASHIKYCSIFYEGQHDDARTNLAIALTAAEHGAKIANHCSCVELIKESPSSQKVIGAVVRDELTGETFKIYAHSVALCGGPFTDELRSMEASNITPAVKGATGIHIVLPSYYAPEGIGLVDMSTSDGRFLFLLPWQGHVIVGTTDTPCKDICMRPEPEEEQIQWLLKECSKYLNPELKVRREDVLSAWSGIRPLAVDPHAKSTASVSRDHVISHNPDSGVVFISGGKWTTYREMASDLVDKVLSVNTSIDKKDLKPSSTLNIPLHGRDGYTANLPIRLSQQFKVSITVAKRLASAYGGYAQEVCQIAEKEPKYAEYLLPGQPYIKAEVIYSVRHEWARKAEDIIARRIRLAFLDKQNAIKAVPVVVDLMGDELKWNTSKRKEEKDKCLKFLEHFGGPVPK